MTATHATVTHLTRRVGGVHVQFILLSYLVWLSNNYKYILFWQCPSKW